MSLFNRGEAARNRVFLDKVTAPTERRQPAHGAPSIDGTARNRDLRCCGARLPVIDRARAKYLFLALDRKGSAGRRSGHPIPAVIPGLTQLIKVTAHIHWNDPKQER